MQREWLFCGQDYICNFRSAGILIKNHKILLQRDRKGVEYAVPGGHVQIGETAEAAIVREFQEETGADIVCERLIWTEECFWKWNGKDTSTLAFYYLIDFCDKSDIPDKGEFFSQKDNANVVLRWVPLKEIESLRIYPAFLKEKALHLAAHPEHFVTRE